MTIIRHHIDHPGAWKAADIGNKDRIAIDWTADQLAALEETMRRIRERGLTLDEVERRDFDHPALNAFLAGILDEVQNGRGIVLIRGLPVERYSLDELAILFWGIGTHLGNGVSQSVLGDRVGHVMDMTKSDPHARAYRHNRELLLHTDFSEILGMLSVRTARSGGFSRYASVPAIHNEILASHPEYLEPLYEGFPDHRHGEERPGEPPVTPYSVPILSEVDGKVSGRYVREYMVSASKALGTGLPPLFAQAMAYFDEVAQRPDVMVEYLLEPGEITFMNNFTVLHARTRFESSDEPGRQRHLMRLWLDVPEGRPVVPAIKTLGGIPKREGRRPSFNRETLEVS